VGKIRFAADEKAFTCEVPDLNILRGWNCSNFWVAKTDLAAGPREGSAAAEFWLP
jgi:hypothetical protein